MTLVFMNLTLSSFDSLLKSKSAATAEPLPAPLPPAALPAVEPALPEPALPSPDPPVPDPALPAEPAFGSLAAASLAAGVGGGVGFSFCFFEQAIKRVTRTTVRSIAGHGAALRVPDANADEIALIEF